MKPTLYCGFCGVVNYLSTGEARSDFKLRTICVTMCGSGKAANDFGEVGSKSREGVEVFKNLASSKMTKQGIISRSETSRMIGVR